MCLHLLAVFDDRIDDSGKKTKSSRHEANVVGSSETSDANIERSLERAIHGRSEGAAPEQCLKDPC